MRFEERLMTFCITKKCSGGKGLGPFGVEGKEDF